MSNRLSKIEWNEGQGPQGLDEIRMWGIEPIQALARAIIGNVDLEPKEITAIAYLIGDKADEINEALMRFMEQLEKGGES